MVEPAHRNRGKDERKENGRSGGPRLLNQRCRTGNISGVNRDDFADRARVRRIAVERQCFAVKFLPELGLVEN